MSALKDAMKTGREDTSASIIKNNPSEKSGWNLDWLRNNANTIVLAATLGLGAISAQAAPAVARPNQNMAGSLLLASALTGPKVDLTATDSALGKSTKFDPQAYRLIASGIPSTIDSYLGQSKTLNEVSEADLKKPEAKVIANNYLTIRKILVSELDTFARQHAAGVSENALTEKDVKIASEITASLGKLNMIPVQQQATQATLLERIKAIPEATASLPEKAVALAGKAEVKVGEGVEAVKNNAQFQRLAGWASGIMMPAIDSAAKKLKNSM